MINRYFTPPPPAQGLIGHRGIAARAPENTLVGFKLAAEEGVSWIEFDIQLTHDQKLVIIHDDTLERTTDGGGLVCQKTLSELQSLDAGSWFSSQFKNEKIPELGETLSTLREFDIFLNIELKIPEQNVPFSPTQFADCFVNVLDQYWPKSKPLPLISSFQWPFVEAVRSIIPSIPIGFLHESCSFTLIDEVYAHDNAAFHCDWRALTPEFLRYANDLSVPILAYTVNDSEKASSLLEQGVFGLFTDDPIRLAKEIPPIR